jgi:catechol 2,3-dioxygenase-like lactoylglutathione lyase family enzyme
MAIPSTRLEAGRHVEGIDHVTISTRDARAAKRFYEVALQPLGFSVVFDWPDGGRTYLGVASESSSLWLVQRSHPGRVAVSLAAADSSAVEAFYVAALMAGGESVSFPAHRPEHTPFTYSAEVLDPDGNTLEAICWHAEPLPRAAHAA